MTAALNTAVASEGAPPSEEDIRTVSSSLGCAQGYVFAVVEESIERSTPIDEHRLIGLVLFGCANTQFMEYMNKTLHNGEPLAQATPSEMQELKDRVRADTTRRVREQIEVAKHYYASPNSPARH